MASEDEFFEEESEIGKGTPAKASQTRGKAAPAAPAKGKAKAEGGKGKPTSFRMVVGIAVAALVLGYCLGYFVCIATTSNKIEQKFDNLASEYSSEVNEGAVSSMVAAASAQGESTGTSEDVNEEAGLPEGRRLEGSAERRLRRERGLDPRSPQARTKKGDARHG